ncbi:MAG: hypothetical protein WKF89_10770 [Chitinophagaceae bacterium]
MFNSPVLELVILLSFIYFMGSVMLSAISEAIAGAFRLRQKHLKDSLEHLFFDNEWKSFVQKSVMTSPHIQSLMKTAKDYPVYIPSSNFSQVIIEQIGPDNFTKDRIQAAISQNTTLPPSLKIVLLDLLAKAQFDIDLFERLGKEFYVNAMDRASGWYKRKIRSLLLIMGFFLAVVFNLDTIQIGNESLKNPNKLDQTVDRIVSQLPNIKLTKDSVTVVTIKDLEGATIIEQRIVEDSNAINSRLKDTLARRNQFNHLKIYLQRNSGYRLGYSGFDDIKRQWFGTKSVFILKLLGIIITAFALQLGSNYWFDLINKAVNIRAAGKKPDENVIR